MTVPFWVWALTIGVVVGLLAVDFLGHARRPHAPTLRESAAWSAAYVGAAVAFGLLVWWFGGGGPGKTKCQSGDARRTPGHA